MTTVAAAHDEEEGWMELAARDDHLVAELLLRLRCAVPPPALPIDWSVRQPRSVGPKEEEEDKKKRRRRRKQTQTQTLTQTQTQSKEEGVEPTRASPATPLSWSGATSTSGGGGDGHEESSRPVRRPPYNARSKVSTLTATPSHMTPATRRPKRKKTLPELKEEESLLLRERRNLRHELAALRLIIKQERAKNDIFKQKRLGLQLLRAKTISASDMRADCEPLKISSEERDNIGITAQHDTQADNIFAATRGERCEMMYELPDLNVPLEEHHGT